MTTVLLFVSLNTQTSFAWGILFFIDLLHFLNLLCFYVKAKALPVANCSISRPSPCRVLRVEAILCWAVSECFLLLPQVNPVYRVNSLNAPVHTICSLDQGLTVSVTGSGLGRH